MTVCTYVRMCECLCVFNQKAWAKYNSSQYANVAFNMRIVWTSNPEPGALSSLRDQENENENECETETETQTQTEHKVDCWSPDESKKERRREGESQTETETETETQFQFQVVAAKKKDYPGNDQY